MTLNPFFRHRCSLLATVICALMLGGLGLRAEEDEAYARALKLSEGPTKQGFRIHADYWKGNMASGEKIALKSQLFKGNEYWYWLGAQEEGVEITMDIYNSGGELLQVETVTKAGAKGILVKPPKTGLYLVIFTITRKAGVGKFDWALAQAYR